MCEYPMDWQGSQIRGKRPHQKNGPFFFFNSLHFDNNHVYRKLLNIKLLLFRKIYNFITKTYIYEYRFEKNEKLLKECLVCCHAFVNHRRQARTNSLDLQEAVR